MSIPGVRAQFPSLSEGYVFADNAGGSQCTQTVIRAVTDYLTNTNVQLGADYSVGVKSTTRVALGPAATAILMNASSPSDIVFSNSSTQLAENLARALEPGISQDGSDEFIATLEHETNVGCWERLAQRTNSKMQFWKPTQVTPANTVQRENKYAVGYDIASIVPLLSAKTRLVAISACSNILGSLSDIKGIVRTIREVVREKSDGQGKVDVVVDCVAYAPHRRIDVQDWDVDYAFFSYYKVYGPHTAAMYMRKASVQASLHSIAHYFITDLTNQFQLGGPGYELTYAVSWVLQYLLAISNSESYAQEPTQESLVAARIVPVLKTSFDMIATHERLLVQRLLSYLTAKEQWNRGIRVVGSEEPDINRAPTISFVIIAGQGGEPAVRSSAMVAGVDSLGGIGIRYGHFYAARLIESLGLTDNDGVVRVSLVHYNTLEEVDRIINALKSVLGM